MHVQEVRSLLHSPIPQPANADQFGNKAIIIGAGPTGLAAALRLKRTNANIRRITVYELRPEPTTLGGAVGIMPNGMRLLHRLDERVYMDIMDRGYSGNRFTMRSAREGRWISGDILSDTPDALEYACVNTGGYGYMRIKRSDLVDALLQAVILEEGVDVVFGKRITEIREHRDDAPEEKVAAVFSDGTSHTADLLIACDGIHSSVRRLYVEPDQVPEYSGLSAIISIIHASDLSESARAEMQAVQGLNSTLTQDGAFIVMPCTPAKDEFYWGWSEEVAPPNDPNSRDGWEEHGHEAVNGFKEHLHGILNNSANGDSGGPGRWAQALHNLIDCTSLVKFYPVYRLPSGGKWFRGRCVILGDAAHAMQPHAGQGVSMALEDVFLLTRLLAAQDPSSSTFDKTLTRVFDKYDRIRRPRVNQVSALSTRRGGMRRKATPWELWTKEMNIWISAWVTWALGSNKKGRGQEHIVYDVDSVPIDDTD